MYPNTPQQPIIVTNSKSNKLPIILGISAFLFICTTFSVLIGFVFLKYQNNKRDTDQVNSSSSTTVSSITTTKSIYTSTKSATTRTNFSTSTAQQSSLRRLTDAEVEAMINSSVNQVNAIAPTMIDSVTRLDSAENLGSRIIQFNYTILSVEKEGTTLKELDEFEAKMTTAIIAYLKQDEKVQIALYNDVSFIYKYADKNGNFYIGIIITPEDYK